MRKERYAFYRNEYIFENVSRYDFPFEAGKIVDTETNEPAVKIEFDRDAYTKYGFHFSVGRFSGEHLIIFDEVYLDTIRNHGRIFEALSMHELGHILNGDTNGDRYDPATTSADIRAERSKYLAEGKVMPEELAADRFAVEQLGKSAMINALEYLKGKRKVRENDPGKELSILELELRLKAIKKK